MRNLINNAVALFLLTLALIGSSENGYLAFIKLFHFYHIDDVVILKAKVIDVEIIDAGGGYTSANIKIQYNINNRVVNHILFIESYIATIELGDLDIYYNLSDPKNPILVTQQIIATYITLFFSMFAAIFWLFTFHSLIKVIKQLKKNDSAK